MESSTRSCSCGSRFCGERSEVGIRRRTLHAPACRFGPVWFVVVRVEEEAMPKIIVNAFLTLDGVMQAPGGPDEDREGGFQHGGWQAAYTDENVGRLVVDGVKDADAFLLGRKTYDIFSSY